MAGALVKVGSATLPGVAAEAFKVACRLGTFGYAEISSEMSVGMEAATRIVRLWLAEGKCLEADRGTSGRKQFRVAPEFAAPESGADLRYQRMWHAMRGLQQFSPTDVAAHSNIGDIGITPEMASVYAQTLLRADYLRVVRTAIPGVREAIYRLIQNTGPRAPRERRLTALVDDNLGGDPVHYRFGAK